MTITEVPDVDALAAAIRSWTAELLGEPDVDLTENFLDLGGHSLLAIQLSRRCEQRFGRPIDMRVLFESALADVAVQLRDTLQSDVTP
jgi:acyl carrier protein